MTFWNNLSQKTSETTAKAVQKAKELSDIAKFNGMISEEETKLNNIYYQIGKLYAAMHAHDFEKDFAGMMAVVVESNEKIQNYKQQIQDIKGVVRCAQCGAEVQAGAAFCSSCGAAMPKAQPAQKDGLVQCEGCGAMVSKDVRFCTSCGRPMGHPSAPEAARGQEAAAAPKKLCPNCGTEAENDSGFCVECGTRL